MIDLTRDTKQLIDILFCDSNKREVIKKSLKIKCAENIPFCRNCTPEGLERIRFAIIKLLHEGESLEDLVKLANTDWRDLLVCAGFENDLKEHNIWKNNIFNQNAHEQMN